MKRRLGVVEGRMVGPHGKCRKKTKIIRRKRKGREKIDIIKMEREGPRKRDVL
jgi:hypothetical protein